MGTDFTQVTETPGSRVTSEQLARLYLRYHTARSHSVGKEVLEVASGAGLGLGYLRRKAKKVVGGDYTEHLLRVAQSYYQGRVPLVCLDAHHLPFREHLFDVVICFEAIYYMAHPEQVIAEIRRVLSNGGVFLMTSWNKDWLELIPGPLSVRYFSAPELRDLLLQQSFRHLEFFGAFPTAATSAKQKMVSLIRRGAVAFDLVPDSLEIRKRLKRLFYGRLTPLQSEIEDGMAKLCPLVPIPSGARNTEYQVLYVIARAL